MVAFFTVFMTALGYRQPIAAPASRILCHPTVTAPRHGDTREHENGTKWIQSWKFSENNYRHLNVSRYFENHARIAMEPEQHLPKYIFALIIFTEYPLFWMMSGYLKWKICLTLQEQGIVALLCAVHWRQTAAAAVMILNTTLPKVRTQAAVMGDLGQQPGQQWSLINIY